MSATKKRETTQSLAEDAAKAHTDLNVFAGVVALMEGGLLSVDSQSDEFAVVRLCRRAQDKCLHRYDRAIAKLALLGERG